MAGSRLPGPVGIEILTGSGIKPVERAGRSGAAGSTPGPLKESKFSLKEKELFLDIGQLVLDVIGIFEPTPFADSANAAVSLCRGNWLGAGLSVISVVPYVGDLAKGGKLPKYARSLSEAISLAKVNPQFAQRLRPVLIRLKSVLDDVPLEMLPQSSQEVLRGIKYQLNSYMPTIRRVTHVVHVGLDGARLDKLCRYSRDTRTLFVVRFRNPRAARFDDVPGFAPKSLEVKSKTWKEGGDHGGKVKFRTDSQYMDPSDRQAMEKLYEKGFSLDVDGILVDPHGKKVYGDLDLQGVFKQGSQGYIPINTNSVSWQVHLNKEVFGRDLVQHGGENLFRIYDKERKVMVAGRQPDLDEGYLIIEQGKPFLLHSPSDLFNYYKKKGLPWPY